MLNNPTRSFLPRSATQRFLSTLLMRTVYCAVDAGSAFAVHVITV